MVIEERDPQLGYKVLGLMLGEGFGQLFLCFLQRFEGFLFFFTLLNTDTIRLIELVLWFLWCGCWSGGWVYIKILVNHAN